MVFNCFTRIRLTAAGIGRSRAANVATIFALTLPIVVGAAGFGVETSYWYYNSLRLQATADAAAYAGALEQISGSDTPTIVAAATQSAATNGLGAGTIVVNTPPASGPNTAKKAVEVIVGQKLDRMFTLIFTQTQVPEQARAVALITNASKACILALDPTASQAALFSGNTSVKFTGCSVMANSIASDAIKLQGSAGLQVDCLITAGGVSLSNPVTTVCAAPITQALPAADPFAGLPAPAASNPCKNINGNKTTQTIQPGTYCSGLSLSGDVTLSPGVYVVQGGDFKVNANANVFGDGVTIYLAGASRVSMNGNATVNLSAPTSGSYSGVLMYGDRTATGGQSTFNGTATSLLTGALYFPRQQVNYLGNFSGKSGCTQVVADMIQWSGNATINQDCTSLGMGDIFAAQSVMLVE
ncbi:MULTISPECIES: pilus assembly protein TadG-related protein [unclassified Mesorhizobium]|uniref:pilus assembly protein TadG-related protein n=1 Tax=unclassified Mesorhizobium TaxID=325217 RepID=UPI0015E2AE31|nr:MULTISPECIES: pilus assembly protein TadG-related protein [unclassified Mesorhizobium]MBZ9724879.1 pilus assembly protein TadG-related protein [Mesorhizobium sp. CO1-1-11]MBZ9910405.1 pilus assembly protein TadG-related protein [Mesorhizobium sp. BR115XR7A]MBZ9933475.1 pilus assembly protein TadG-related protein [Mesorhizobium sp. BR1-1-5]